MKKRFSALLLSLCLVWTGLPMTVTAATERKPDIEAGTYIKMGSYIGTAPNKQERDCRLIKPDEDLVQNWDISTDQSIQLTLGKEYSSDRKYANPTIPVYVLQKPRSDTENMVIVICGEGYTKSQQGKFIKDAKKMWNGVISYEPYRSMADRFNVYALCTASETSFGNDGSTFFDVVVGRNYANITTYNSSQKNHIFERCIGPAFIDKIHDAHIPETTDPNKDFDYSSYYYVHRYISQFALLVNTGTDFGAAYNNLQFGFHYFIAPADSTRASAAFTHELGHGLLCLGDEYASGKMDESTDKISLNVGYTGNPNQVKWKEMLGFRGTYSCPHQGAASPFNSSFECLMRDTNYQLCEVCKLQGFKRMSQLIENGSELYVADPEVKKYTGRYTPAQLSDFEDASINGYFQYKADRTNRLLSGTSKTNFDFNTMKNQQVELRTIVQNLSETRQRQVTLRLWVEHADGGIATTTSGVLVQETKTFDIPVWGDKPKFRPKGALEYAGSDFDSGLKSCSLVYTIPMDAQLKAGDTIGFAVEDEKGNILAHDDTETQAYANVTVLYKFDDGTEIPNTQPSTIPVRVGTVLNWEPSKTLNGHTFIRAVGLGKTVDTNGLEIIYYYKGTQPGSEQPAKPEQSSRPEQPSQPEQPSRPEQPSQPEQSSRPEQPSQPEQPSWSEQPSRPEQPSQPGQPEQSQSKKNLKLILSATSATLTEGDMVTLTVISTPDSKLSSVKVTCDKDITIRGSGSKWTVQLNDAGTYTFTAFRAEDDTYKDATAQITVTVEKKRAHASNSRISISDVKPKDTSLTSLTGQKNTIIVKWKKQTKQTTGYQIQYATKKKFSNARTVTVKKNSIVKQKLTKCSAKRTYYVRIRTYKDVKVKGKTVRITSSWSSIKTVATK